MVRQTWGSHVMDFVYDNTGKPYALKYDGTLYYYVLNLQGDVISIVTHWGESYGSYTYDAWGNVISQSGSIASINPIRYRGYYYDSETGLYYLGSRYYDPQVRRFVNADSTDPALSAGFLGANLFAYVQNCPTMYSDSIGTWPSLSTVLFAGAIVATAVAVTAAAVATGGIALGAVGAVAGSSVLVGSSATAAGIAATAGDVAIATGAAAVVTKAAEDCKERGASRNHTVYRLVDGAGNTQYVGRTCNVNARRNAHKRDPSKSSLRFEIIKSNLTYAQARGLEQIAMTHYNTRAFLNRINGISPKNKRLNIYMEAGRQVAHYLGNRISNEALYWSGR